MAKTEAQVLADLREALYDSTIPYMWTDAMLKLAIREGVAEHSLLFPQEAISYVDVANGQREFTLYPVNDPGYLSAGVAASASIPIPPPPSGNSDIISIDGIELPLGTPIPADVQDTTTPARSSSSRTTQGYITRGTNYLRLRRAAVGAEVGASKLVIFLSQTWNFPDAGTVASWNGPNHDYPLVLLLVRRQAYSNLAERQFRNQGEIGYNTIVLSDTTGVSASTREVVLDNLEIVNVIAQLEVEIKRAIEFRLRRAARSRSMSV